jgi:hypothetical protein
MQLIRSSQSCASVAQTFSLIHSHKKKSSRFRTCWSDEQKPMADPCVHIMVLLLGTGHENWRETQLFVYNFCSRLSQQPQSGHRTLNHPIQWFFWNWEDCNYLSSKNSIFWDITLCIPLKINRHIRKTCHLHLKRLRISQARNQSEAGSMQSWLTFKWTTQHYIQKTELFITTIVRTSNPTS